MASYFWDPNHTLTQAHKWKKKFSILSLFEDGNESGIYKHWLGLAIPEGFVLGPPAHAENHG